MGASIRCLTCAAMVHCEMEKIDLLHLVPYGCPLGRAEISARCQRPIKSVQGFARLEQKTLFRPRLKPASPLLFQRIFDKRIFCWQSTLDFKKRLFRVQTEFRKRLRNQGWIDGVRAKFALYDISRFQKSKHGFS